MSSLQRYLLGYPARPEVTAKKKVTHTHTHPFNSPLSVTTWVSWYHKGETNMDFTEVRDRERKKKVI